MLSINKKVIPQVRMFFKAEDRANLFDMLRRIKTSARQTYTRYGTGSVVMFGYAESPMKTISEGDWLRRAKGAVQTGSQAMYLMLFALSYGMTARSKIL